VDKIDFNQTSIPIMEAQLETEFQAISFCVREQFQTLILEDEGKGMDVEDKVVEQELELGTEWE
jgi:hypothetical protein